jgi:hypothetical protein
MIDRVHVLFAIETMKRMSMSSLPEHAKSGSRLDEVRERIRMFTAAEAYVKLMSSVRDGKLVDEEVCS